MNGEEEGKREITKAMQCISEGVWWYDIGIPVNRIDLLKYVTNTTHQIYT